ncbi:hypothetical protein ACFY6U_37275 [Streptomyces sp. NPDC013157]|uniref:hypothetical protein n=1 Tax=Streptomyces sp. NPDC013157 TaxID=3364861 RepID=UPI0036836BCE
MDTVSTAAALGRVLDTVLQHQLSLDQSVALRSSAVRPGEDFAGIFGPETKERFGLLLGGTLTGWASWRWVMYVNTAFAAHPDRCLAAAGQARDHLVQKPKLDIPGIVVVSEGRPAVLDNSVQNRLGF